MSSPAQQKSEPDDPRVTVLQALLEVVRSDSDLLSQHPEIIWQQVYNKPHGKEESISHLLQTWLADRYGTPTTPPWLKFRRLLRAESPALIRRFPQVLSGEGGGIDDCVLSPDGTLVASVSLAL